MIRIGTRDSELALAQARKVWQKINVLGHCAQIIPLKSEGDLELKKPLYEMGITGVFTKVLDIALLENKIDLAVHSLKDVPTTLPKGITYGAFLPGDSYQDIIVYKSGSGSFFNNRNSTATIATSSLRRKAAWLNRFYEHKVENLRGNVNTRLKKLQESNWDGAIFAKAGLERINLLEKLSQNGLNYACLDWMIPAPAQGVVAVMCLDKRKDLLEKIHLLNSPISEIEATVERDFLNTLEGGCTAPIGAKATLKDGIIELRTSLYSLDGKVSKRQIMYCERASYKTFGKQAGAKCLQNGGETIMRNIKRST